MMISETVTYILQYCTFVMQYIKIIVYFGTKIPQSFRNYIKNSMEKLQKTSLRKEVPWMLRFDNEVADQK